MGLFQLIRRWLGYRLQGVARAIFADPPHRTATYERHREVDLALGRLQRRASHRQARAR